jgi:phosphoglycerate dehydrogenase-like enzyme
MPAQPLRIWTDLRLSGAALELLHQETQPHQLILSKVPASSILSGGEPDPDLQDADIAFGQPDVAGLVNAPRLRWIHITTAGYTRYDTDAFRAHVAAHKIVVTNSSQVFAEPCVEQVLSYMLAQTRQLPLTLGTICGNGSNEWNHLRQTCSTLCGQSVLLVGFGVIARRLAEVLAPFRMHIRAFRRKARGNEGLPVLTEVELPEALATSDHVINILPDNPSSRHFFNGERFRQMKAGSVFYNIGRGTTVDQTALAGALEDGHLRAAWLDVTDPEPLPADHPLRLSPNCYITPHTGGGHAGENESLVNHFLQNFKRHLQGEPLLDRIM